MPLNKKAGPRLADDARSPLAGNPPCFAEPIERLTTTTTATLAMGRPLALARSLAVALMLAQVGPVLANDPAPTAPVDISVPAGPLAEAINRFALQTGVTVAMDAGLLARLQSAGLQGRYSVEDGLAQLLAGSGFRAVRTASGYVLESLPVPRGTPAPGSAASPTLPTVQVRSTRSAADPLPETFAGGQVARGGRLGLLGNRDVLDTPFNQTSFTSEFIANQQARTLADVVANDPSIAVDNPTAAGWEAAIIRGFTAGDGTGSVAINGLYGIAPDDASSVGWAERVEILKGPSALLGGMPPADAIGGSINMVTKRAPDEPLTEVGLTYATRAQWGLTTDVARRFGPTGAVGVRFSGQWRNGEVAVAPTRERLGFGVLGVDYRSDRVRLSADLGRQERTLTGANRPLFLGPQAIPAVPRNDRSYLPGWTIWNSGGTFGMVQGEWDLTDRLTAHAAWGMRRSDGKTNLFINPVLLGANGDWEATPALSKAAGTSRSALAGLNWRLDTGPVRHALALDYTWIRQTEEYTQTWGDDLEFVSNLYNPPPVGRPDLPLDPLAVSSRSTRASLGIADTLSLFDDRVQFTVGARRQSITSRNYDRDTGAVDSSYESHVWSPAAALVIRPTRQVSLYANYIEGLQPGQTVSDRYLNAGEVFAPYQSEQVEAGIKTEWHQRLITTVSLFQIARPSTVELPTQPAPTLAVNGEQRNRGIEFNVFGEPIRGVRVNGGLTVINAKLRKTDGGEDEGNRAPAVPRWRAVVSGEWDLPPLPGLTVIGRVRHSDRAYVDNANTRSVPSWTLYDLGLRYRFDSPWGKDAALRLTLENVLDKNFWISRTYGVYQSSPRTLLMSLSTRF